MKKTLLNLLAITVIAIATVACGSSKKAANQSSAYPGETAIAADPCEIYALAKPVQRATGIGVHFKEATAKNQAELQARAALARTIQTCIITSTKDYADALEMFAADDEAGATKTDQTASQNDFSATLSKELVRGAVVVKMSKYRTQNNQFRIVVCVEYNEEIPEIAAKIAKTYQDKLSVDEKTRIKFNEQKFKEEIETELKNYQSATM